MGKSPKSSFRSKMVNTPKAARKFTDRNLGPVNPKNTQFEPTTSNPVRAHVKMAGG